MNKYTSTLSALLLAAGATCAQASSSVSASDPILMTDVSLCGPHKLIEGIGADCSMYQRAGEPAQPVTHFGKTRVSFRLLWSTALYNTVIVRIEVISDTEAELHAYGMSTRGDEAPLSVHSFLHPAEIRRLLRDADRYSFWALASTRDYPVETPLPNGKVMMQFCADSGDITIEGFKAGVAHAIAREDCRFDGSDKGIPKFARTMTKIAKAHFADLPTYYFLGHDN